MGWDTSASATTRTRRCTCSRRSALRPGAARGSCGLRSRQQCAHLARAAPLQRALHPWRDLQGAPGCALGRALPHAGAGDVLRLPDPVAPALSHERVSRAWGRALRDPGSRRDDGHAVLNPAARGGARQVARRQADRAHARARRHHGGAVDQAFGVSRTLRRAQCHHADGCHAARRGDLPRRRGSNEGHGDQRPLRRSLLVLVEARGHGPERDGRHPEARASISERASTDGGAGLDPSSDQDDGSRVTRATPHG